MDDYRLGQIVGYLRSIEAPEWIEEMLGDIDSERNKIGGGKSKKHKAKKAVEDEPEEDEGQEETEEVEEDDNDTPYDRFKKLYDAGDDASTQADKLGLPVSVIYAWRQKYKKELEG